ncbi:hypothetical protein DPEC_G00349320 [Dallia pectoralis]|uniref:Uncharacterized protein n=1 Tax=Dallia pectoralis TaxID=75939 RepID=A0ACC2F1G1_DALPE|nr:hypothetical protein DPEC_G00349320 [Dallia pectoralis]
MYFRGGLRSLLRARNLSGSAREEMCDEKQTGVRWLMSAGHQAPSAGSSGHFPPVSLTGLGKHQQKLGISIAVLLSVNFNTLPSLVQCVPITHTGAQQGGVCAYPRGAQRNQAHLLGFISSQICFTPHALHGCYRFLHTEIHETLLVTKSQPTSPCKPSQSRHLATGNCCWSGIEKWNHCQSKPECLPPKQHRRRFPENATEIVKPSQTDPLRGL